MICYSKRPLAWPPSIQQRSPPHVDLLSRLADINQYYVPLSLLRLVLDVSISFALTLR